MKTIFKISLIILFIPILMSCGDDDGPSIDSRSTYTGTYEFEDFDMEANFDGDDSVFTVDDGALIEIEFAADASEVEFEVEHFIARIMSRAFEVGYLVTFEDPLITTINADGSFEIDETDFTFKAFDVYNGSFSMEGTIEDGNITIEFEYKFSGSSESYNFSGEAEGEKD